MRGGIHLPPYVRPRVISYPDLTLFHTEKWSTKSWSPFPLAVGDLGTRLVRGLSLEVIGPLSVKPWCCWLWSLISRCVLWARFYIFSYKYKSSKPSVVEYIYQLKDNILIEQQIQLLNERRNFQKRRLFERNLLFSRAFFFQMQYEEIPNRKEK